MDREQFSMVAVRYHCPRCETVVELERDARLADKSVTPYPLEGWDYAPVDGDYEAADGIRIVCGEADVEGEGCGEPYYLNFVRYEDGRPVEAPRESETVELAPAGPTGPRGPDWPR
jgi:hypothetical protein